MSEEQGELSPENDAPIADSSTAPVTESETEVGNPEVTEPKKVNKVQARINQLTREKHELRQQLSSQEQRLQALETRPTEQPKPTIAPNENDFDTDTAYKEASSKYITETATEAAYQRFTSENKASEEAQSQATENAQWQIKQKAFFENVESKSENFEDFDNVAYGHQFMDAGIATELFEMDKGPEVAYHLGSNLEIAEKIFALNPVQRARELTKLEFQLEALNPKKVSTAPDAIKPLGNNSTPAETDPEKMNADDWQAWRCKQLNL